MTGPRARARLARDARILGEEYKGILQSHTTTEAFGDYFKLSILLSNIVVTGFCGEITGAGERDAVRLRVV